MDVIEPLLTPALMVALVAWLRRELTGRMDRIEKRIDGVSRELAGLRERMAKLEGWLERNRLGAPDRDTA